MGFGNTSTISPEMLNEHEVAIIGAIRTANVPFVIIGIVTNIFNIMVYMHPSMRKMSTVAFLTAMAFADIAVTIFMTFRIWVEWMPELFPHDLFFNDTFCQIVNFCGHASRDISNWLVAFITIERMILIVMPLKARQICTVFRARVLVLVLVLIQSISYIPVVFNTSAVFVNRWLCWTYPDESFFSRTIITVFIISSFVIPGVLILNVILGILVCSAQKIQSSQDDHLEQTRRLTRMLLSIGIFFSITEMPLFCAVLIYRYYGRTPSTRIFTSTAYLFSGINHASNFFIFVLSGERFRDVFLEIMRCGKTNKEGDRPHNKHSLSSTKTVSTMSVEG